MKSQEAKELGQLAGQQLRQVTGVVHGAHKTITGTVHGALRRALGPSVNPVLQTIDTVTGGVYAVTGLGLDGASRVAGIVAGQRLRELDAERPSVHDSARGHQAIAIGLGIRGDAMLIENPSIAPAMHLRVGGRWVESSPEGLATAYPDPSGEIVVLLHGLCETETSWRLGADIREPYADRLAHDLGLTPVLVRYNSGLRISDNGAALGALLADLVAGWPVPLTRIVLIGHSMGGLVIHSALAQVGPERRWPQLVTETVSLGSPHHGSPVARGVHRAAEALAAARYGRWLGDYLEQRSAGVRDLSYGNVLPQDWSGYDPRDPSDRRTHPQAYPGINHHAVIALIGPTPSRVSQRVGDLMVPMDSAMHAATAQVPSRFAEERVAVVTGVNHQRLLNDDAVYAYLLRWLGPASSASGAGDPEQAPRASAVQADSGQQSVAPESIAPAASVPDFGASGKPAPEHRPASEAAEAD